jgi:hypothetical protein
MSEELQSGTVDRPQAPAVATAANSTTLAVQLASQKKWRIAARVATVLSAVGFTATAVPATFLPGLIVGGLGGLLAVFFASQSGAEFDEAALEKVTTRVATLLEQRSKGGAP